MGKIIYFDYCAFILLLVLMFTTIYRRMLRGKSNQYFLLIILTVFVAVVADICAVNWDRIGYGNMALRYISHTVYLLFHVLTPLCYITYLFALTDTWHVLHKNRLLSSVIFVPNAIIIILLLANPATKFIFYFDENGTYTRGSGMVILYAVTIIYAIYSYAYLYKYRKALTKIQRYMLTFIFPLQMAATIIQYFLPNHLIELFINAISLTLVSMMIQRPEEMIDNETGLLKLSAYVRNMESSALTKKPMEIILINITNHTILSDMLGYEQRKKLLSAIAHQLDFLNRKQRLDAEIYYLGNGKYRIVINNDHFDQTQEIADMVMRQLKAGIEFHQMQINLVPIVCIARYPEDIDNIDALLAFGNDLNSLPYTGEVIYGTDIFKTPQYVLIKDIDRIIEKALAEHNFEVYYQPIYSVNEQCFNSAEALLRLKDDQYGFVSPDIFIPAAEKSGAIHKIGDFVMEEVCKFISSPAFSELGIDYIEVNLSVAQCMQHNLADDILTVLDQYNVSPNQINLEITETAASYSQNVMMENLTKLTNAGVHFSLDDYGTGYSNIRRIASLPLNIIKLDKSFTNMHENPKLLVILENTIRMIKDMNLKIVVEGIETAEMVEQFSELECEYIQGYYYSKPIPKKEFVSFIQASNT